MFDLEKYVVSVCLGAGKSLDEKFPAFSAACPRTRRGAVGTYLHSAVVISELWFVFFGSTGGNQAAPL